MCGSELPDEAVFCTNCGAACEEETENTTVLDEELVETELSSDDVEETTVLSQDGNEETTVLEESIEGTTVLEINPDSDKDKDTTVLSPPENEKDNIKTATSSKKVTEPSNKNGFDEAINGLISDAKNHKKAIIRIVVFSLLSVVAVVFAVLFGIRTYNMNISNPSGSVDLSSLKIVDESEHLEVTFKPTDNLETIMKNNPNLTYSIYQVDAAEGDYNNLYLNEDVDNPDDSVFSQNFSGAFTFYVGICPENTQYSVTGFDCYAEDTTPLKAHITSLNGYGSSKYLNDLQLMGSTARKASQLWGVPDKVTEQNGGLFKRLYYYGENCEITLYVNILGKIDWVYCEFK